MIKSEEQYRCEVSAVDYDSDIALRCSTLFAICWQAFMPALPPLINAIEQLAQTDDEKNVAA